MQVVQSPPTSFADSRHSPDSSEARRLLDYFPQSRKSTIANLFLGRVRAGKGTTPEAIARAAITELGQRIERALGYAAQQQRYGNAESGDYWTENLERMREDLGIIARQPEAVADYARWALYWESLPPSERERQKRSRSEQHIRQHMDREPFTDKQEKFLRGLGYTGPIESKGHASGLIDVYTRGGRVEVAGAA